MSFFKSWKFRIFFPIIIIGLGFIAKFILWDFSISNGKRVGNLVKISHKGKFSFTKTWEGTIDEGSGDKLTSYFSVRDEKIAKELFDYKGKQVIIYYEEHILGWPRDTKYDVTKWEAQVDSVDVNSSKQQVSTDALSLLSQTLFCSLLGTLFTDEELYKKVKKHIEEKNMYLYNQIEKCNE